MSKSRDKHKTKKESIKSYEESIDRIAKMIGAANAANKEDMKKIEKNEKILKHASNEFTPEYLEEVGSFIIQTYTKLVERFKTEAELNKLFSFVNTMAKMPTLSDQNLVGLKNVSTAIESIIKEADPDTRKEKKKFSDSLKDMRKINEKIAEILKILSKLEIVAEQQRNDIVNMTCLGSGDDKQVFLSLNSQHKSSISIMQRIVSGYQIKAENILQLVDGLDRCLAKTPSQASPYSAGSATAFAARSQQPSAQPASVTVGSSVNTKKK